MKKILLILPVVICLFLITLDSCNDIVDTPNPSYNRGYVRIINNTWNSYPILIDSVTSDYCNFVKFKDNIFCDLPVGHHNIQLGGSGCSWNIDISRDKTVNVTCN